jgi:hypothetical protein
MITINNRLNLSFAALATLAFGAVGCGSAAPNVVPVHGKVTLNGQPLTTGRVMTMPVAGRGAGGEIQQDGAFELTTPEFGAGATPGVHKVAVRAYDNAGVTDLETGSGKSLVPERYGNPETSGLTIDVTANGENAPTLELTGP